MVSRESKRQQPWSVTMSQTLSLRARCPRTKKARSWKQWRNQERQDRPRALSLLLLAFHLCSLPSSAKRIRNRKCRDHRRKRSKRKLQTLNQENHPFWLIIEWHRRSGRKHWEKSFPIRSHWIWLLVKCLLKTLQVWAISGLKKTANKVFFWTL